MRTNAQNKAGEKKSCCELSDHMTIENLVHEIWEK